MLKDVNDYLEKEGADLESCLPFIQEISDGKINFNDFDKYTIYELFILKSFTFKQFYERKNG